MAEIVKQKTEAQQLAGAAASRIEELATSILADIQIADSTVGDPTLDVGVVRPRLDEAEKACRKLELLADCLLQFGQGELGLEELSSDSIEPIDGPPLFVLVVDDQKSAGEAIRDILKKTLGCDAIWTDCGSRAIALYQEADPDDSFDITFLDLNMGDGMGAEKILAEIRKIDSEAKAVVMSGDTTDSVMRRPGEHEFEDALTKPFSPFRLRESIRKVLGR